jgi:hypothetical protein
MCCILTFYVICFSQIHLRHNEVQNSKFWNGEANMADTDVVVG